MSEETVLITGGYGCIGAETVKWLLRNTEAQVVVGSRVVSDERTERVFYDIPTDVRRRRLDCVALEMTDPTGIQETLSRFTPSRIVHMAALQTPACNANRDLGLQINLAGTQHLIESIKALELPLKRFVFASSAAVYGPRSIYTSATVPLHAELKPVNVYGAWKLAGEQISRMFAEETSIPTVSLRPGVLYGPGRDAGLTSTPTTAMKCVALGLPYTIPYQSKQDYLFSPDTGGAVGMATMEPFISEDAGQYGVFTLPSHTRTTAELLEAMNAAAERMGLDAGGIAIGDEEVPFICDLEYDAFLAAFPSAPHTTVDAAMEQTLRYYQQQVERGWLTADSLALG